MFYCVIYLFFFFKCIHRNLGFPGGSVVKIHVPVQKLQEMWVWSLGPEDPLKKEMATHSNILAWKVSRTKEPGGLQSMRSQESDMT